MDDGKIHVKVSFVGPSGVGKSCLLYALAQNMFKEDTQATIGVQYLERVEYFQGKTIDFKFWDTAGQDSFRDLLPQYIINSQIILLCYEPSKWNQKEAEQYLSIIRDNADNALILFIITKQDIWIDADVPVDLSPLNNFADLYKIPVFQVSSCTQFNIDLLFNNLKNCCFSIQSKPQEVSVVNFDDHNDSNEASNYHRKSSWFANIC